ncbi:crossover junction endonuclease EME1, partial [Rhea pennata]|uniref:crossover junction endonuclease EME1 n=1 Tax=Rhea pennata TaxID=8795 RepID=UPI002E267C8E
SVRTNRHRRANVRTNRHSRALPSAARPLLGRVPPSRRGKGALRMAAESDEEVLPTFAFLQQPPPAAQRAVAACGSDPEHSSPPSPRRGRAPGSQAASPGAEAVVVLSSDSESEVEIVPLSERLKGKLHSSGPCKTSVVPFEAPQPGGGGTASKARGTELCQSTDQLAPESRGQPLPKSSEVQRALSSSGEVSSSGRNDDMCSTGRPPLCPLPDCLSDSAPQSSRFLGKEASLETSPPPKKSKYSQKEREAVSQAAWQRRKEREARKRQQEQEKERKKALAKMLKAQRPGECQKYITVVLDPVLLQIEGGGQVLSALQSGNYSCVIESQAVPCSITWRRRAVSSQIEEESRWTEEPNILVLLCLEEFLSMVHNYKQEVQGCSEGQKETLQSFVAHVREKMPGKILALAVVGVENYFSSLRAPSKKRLQQAVVNGDQAEEQGKRRKKKTKDSGPDVSRLDVEDALVDLLLHTQVQVRFAESLEELGEFVSMFTKAVAEAPYKREQENTGFSFYLENEWCRGVKVDHSGKGLLEVWKRQIQQLNRVSSEMAEAVVSAYPSPQLLDQAYSKCSSEEERKNMLANILVHRGDGVTATTRRIGPELSRRIYLQMTSHDPDLCLDFTE